MNNQDNPLVSIVVPLFNCERYIEALIQSVIDQDYNNWQLIIVDDGSTDSSVSISKKMAAIDSRITIVLRMSSMVKGGNSCRNIGMDISKGQYIIFADADDILAPYCLTQRVSYMQAHPNCDCAVFPALTFRMQPLDNPDFIIGYNDGHSTLNRLINKALPFAAWNNIYRLEILRAKNVIWDERLKSNQDADFNIGCILKGLTFSYSEGLPDYYWRTNPDGKSLSQHIMSAEHFESNLYYFNKIVNHFSHEIKYQNDILMLAIWFMHLFIVNSPQEHICEFISNSFFQNHPIFKRKVKLISYLKSRFEIQNRKIISSLMILLFPIIELKSRYLNSARPFKAKMDRVIQKKLQKINEINKNGL